MADKNLAQVVPVLIQPDPINDPDVIQVTIGQNSFMTTFSRLLELSRAAQIDQRAVDAQLVLISNQAGIDLTQKDVTALAAAAASAKLWVVQ